MLTLCFDLGQYFPVQERVKIVLVMYRDGSRGFGRRQEESGLSVKGRYAVHKFIANDVLTPVHSPPRDP